MLNVLLQSMSQYEVAAPFCNAQLHLFGTGVG